MSGLSVDHDRGDEERAALLAEWGFVTRRGRRRSPRPARSAGEALRLAVRELRIVLTLLFVLFVTGEAWQFFGRAEGVRFALLLAIFASLATLVGAVVARNEAQFVTEAAAGASTVPTGARRTLARRLRRRTWFETLVAGSAVGAFLALLGAVAVNESLTREWSGRDDGQAFRLLPLSELWQGRVDGQVEIYRVGGGWVVSEPMVRLTILLAAFAALLFAVEVLVDRDLRSDVMDDLLAEWRDAVEAWKADEAAGAGAGRRTPR